jgi:ribosomal protein S12 methylthiotransferase accessory factor
MSGMPEIKVTFPGGLRVDAEYKDYVVKTDQPISQGGGGTAPSPTDLFFVSLATCAGFYTVAFCRERNIPTDKAGIVMRMEKNPETKLIGRIWIEIQLPPDFPERYQRAIIKAVDTCTVKAHLNRPPTIEIALKTGA